MPFYTVEHSYPLTLTQKTQIAEAITHLHTSKFLVPSVFVHVNFKASDASDSNYFVAGKARTTCTNRIVGLVRTSSQRTKQIWEELAQQIEDAWYTAVSGAVVEEGKDKGKRKDAMDDTEKTKEAKQLRAVAFHGIIAVWENGDPVPTAGEEAAWLKEHGKKFQEKADAGDELYTELLDEVTTREDLKKAYGT